MHRVLWGYRNSRSAYRNGKILDQKKVSEEVDGMMNDND